MPGRERERLYDRARKNASFSQLSQNVRCKKFRHALCDQTFHKIKGEIELKISLAFASRSEVLCFLREALQLCMVDDEYSDAERKEIMELAQAFSIEPERVHALETWVQEGIEWKARGDKLLED